ncbi:ATP-binding cassette subfamily C protein CydD [Polymorphobacter multimanifer]|uniref:ATP-binding cassette subfamily C protein CydD n=2 Tax=Polymorphobacter multimanifer TaxID=1070431 RepID=A0A841L804_9SPHN|nr:ATP-binding cassette subfamily C protein CydD [Polymorphobacter multimanifer]
MTAAATTPSGSFAPRSAALRRASLWWLADLAGAFLFAAGLAFTIGCWGGLVPVLGGLAAMLVSGLVRAAAQARAAEAGMAAAIDLKARLRARHLPLLFATAHARARMAGEDAARAVDQIEAIEGLAARYQPLARAARIAPLLVAGAVAIASPVAAGILLLTLIPFTIGMIIAGGAARAAADRQLTAIGRLGGLFADRLRALAEIRSFGAEARIASHLGQASTEVADRTLALLRIAFISSGILEFLAALSVAIVALYCGFSLLGLLPFPAPENLGLTAAFFALALAPEFYLPMRRLAAAYHDRQTGEAASLALDIELPAPAASPPRSTVFTGVTLAGVAVAYDGKVAVGPVSLAVPATGLIAITGPSGCGKSSLLAALAGLQPLHAGTLDWTAGTATAAAWAGQRPLVMAGSIADNVALGGGNPATIAHALEASGLAPLLAARGGDEAPLDAAGSGLSGGERRRLGLARALASGRPLLLLDEPTADLDATTADAIIATLRRLASTHAVVVATHDPALAAAADSRLDLA